MARPASNHPTELELEILKILWNRGSSTVRQVKEDLAPTRKLAHTSVITVMNIMTDKGYLVRDAEGNTHIFRARVSEKSIRRRMLGDLVRRAFDGSSLAVMLNLLDTTELKEDELAELRRRLEDKEKDA